MTDVRAKVVAHPSVPPPAPAEPEVTEFDAPNDLTTDERLVWLELAPHAFKARTLTLGTAVAFKLLCRNILLEREFRASVLDKGRPAHQSTLAKVDAGLARFGLNPSGKAMYDAPAAKQVVNPLNKYLQA